MTAVEAAKRFEAPARAAGVKKDFAAYAANPPPSVFESPGYPRLVAAVYAATVPAEQRADAAAGCAEQLARAGSGGQASSKRAGGKASPVEGSADKKGSN